jgi:hypothetical protein
VSNQALISEPGPVDPTTGTRRLDLWRESAAGGMWGDNARGDGYTARYVSDDGAGCADVAVYPVEYEDGSFGVDEQAIVGRAERDDDGHVRPSDDARIEDDYASALAFDTLERAQEEAERLGRIDQSYALYLRAKP